MQSPAARNRQSIVSRRALVSRRGVSFVEFVGCLVALGGGVVLGSIYLGVDVQAMAVGILEKADIEVPAILSENNPTSEKLPNVESTNIEPTEANAAPTLADKTLPDGPTDASAAQPQGEPASDGETTSDSPERKELTEAEQKAATHACWLALNQYVQEEAVNRSKSINDPKSWHLFDYLLHRKEGHQKVVNAIEQLDLFGVEQRLRVHTQQLLAWHQAGATLYDRAAQLLANAPAGKLSGPFAQSWQSAATQHRMEEKLILNKHAAVASYLEYARRLPIPSDN